MYRMNSSSVQIENDSKSPLCAFSSSERGNHQKVVSFSFFGDIKGPYFSGIKENLDLMKVVSLFYIRMS